MFESRLNIEEKNKLLKDILIIFSFIIFSFFINRQIKISGLYMDDLYMWSCYGEQSFREYVFPIGSTRFRPIYWFVAWIELGVIKNHINLIVPINIIFSSILASLIYFFNKKISKSRMLSFLLGILFLATRFSYYNISQLLGLMEALALLFIFLILSNLYEFIKSGNIKYYYKALIYYPLIVFTHERFMVILPIFFFALLVKKSKRIFIYIFTLLSFIFIQIIRNFTIGTILPAGTGGTEVVETFNLKSIIKNIISQIFYILGINAGPEHLNGIRWYDTPFLYKVLICISIISFLIFFINFIIISFIRKDKNIKEDIIYSIFFLGLIASNILASSVTIRVEMRWIYSSYMIFLIYIAYMYKRIKSYFPDKISMYKYILLLFVLVYFCFNLIFEFYYHTKYKNIYLFPNQKIYNSLADTTYYKYGKEIFGSKIYIIGNQFKMSDFTANTFFKVYNVNKNLIEPEIIHVDSIKDIPDMNANTFVLQESTKNNEFIDISEAVRKIKINPIYGYYSDGWMDERASIDILSGKEGKLSFEIIYPGQLKGNEKIIIEYDNIIREVEIKENISKKDIIVEGNRIINFKFKTNFYMENAKEKRGEDNLSVILNISTK